MTTQYTHADDKRPPDRLAMSERIAPPKKRRGIQSVEIGLRVLASVAATPGPSSLSAIAQRAGISSSQTHRYLSSLIASEMVKQDSGSTHYDLGSGGIRIGLAALARLDILSAADKILRDYSRDTGRSSLISIWGDAGATIIRWFDGDPRIVTSLGIGSVLPLLQSATGHIFYAFDDTAEMNRLGLEAAQRIGRRAEDFQEIRNAAQKNFYARVFGDLIPGLRAIAAPVFDLQGRLVFVAAAMASSANSEADDESALAALIEACRELTESVGGVWPAKSEAATAIKKVRKKS